MTGLLLRLAAGAALAGGVALWARYGLVIAMADPAWLCAPW